MVLATPNRTEVSGPSKLRCPWLLVTRNPFSNWMLPFGTTTLELATDGRSVAIGSSLTGWLWPRRSADPPTRAINPTLEMRAGKVSSNSYLDIFSMTSSALAAYSRRLISRLPNNAP